MWKWIKDYFGYRSYQNNKVMLFELWASMTEEDKEDFYYLLKAVMNAKKKRAKERKRI